MGFLRFLLSIFFGESNLEKLVDIFKTTAFALVQQEIKNIKLFLNRRSCEFSGGTSRYNATGSCLTEIYARDIILQKEV